MIFIYGGGEWSKWVHMTWLADPVAFFIDLNDGNINNNIGITHVFSCINICRVSRKLFEHEAVRPSVQTSSEGPGKC